MTFVNVTKRQCNVMTFISHIDADVMYTLGIGTSEDKWSNCRRIDSILHHLFNLKHKNSIFWGRKKSQQQSRMRGENSVYYKFKNSVHELYFKRQGMICSATHHTKCLVSSIFCRCLSNLRKGISNQSEPWHSISNKIAWAPSKKSNLSPYPCSLIRVFAVTVKTKF